SAHRGGSRRFQFSGRLNDRLHERRQIVRFAAGDQVPVPDYFGVDVLAAGIDHIVFDRKKASCLASFESLGGTQHPGAVTNGRDHFPLLRHGADQANHGLAAAHVIGGITAGDDQDVEVVGGDV